MLRTTAKIIDTDSIGARSVQIKNDHALIHTPARAVTSTEMRYVPDIVRAGYTEIDFPSEIAEITMDFRKPMDRTELIRSNSAFNSRRRNVTTMVNKTKDKLTLLRAVVKPDDVVSKEFRDAVIQLGIESGCRMVSILDSSPLMSADEQDKWLHSAEDFASGFSATLNRDIGLLPSIRLNINDVQDMLARMKAIENRGYDSLNTVLVSYSKFARNYMEFRKRYNKNEFWIHASQVKRKWGFSDEKNASWMHILQYFGMDTFALELPFNFAPLAPRDSVHDKPIPDSYLLDGRTLGIIGLMDYVGTYGENVKSTSPIFRGRDINELAPRMRRKKILDQACKIDEVLTSHAQFTKSREFVKKHESMSYIQQKSSVSYAVRELLANQKMI